jgi:hypothetical protein
MLKKLFTLIKDKYIKTSLYILIPLLSLLLGFFISESIRFDYPIITYKDRVETYTLDYQKIIFVYRIEYQIVENQGVRSQMVFMKNFIPDGIDQYFKSGTLEQIQKSNTELEDIKKFLNANTISVMTINKGIIVKKIYPLKLIYSKPRKVKKVTGGNLAKLN